MPLRFVTATALLAAALAVDWPTRGQEAAPPVADRVGLDLFEKKVRPAFVEHCYACHSAAAATAKKLKGGLRLDTAVGLAKGGDSGPAIVPGKPADSPLIKAVRHADDNLKMPPKGKLPDTVIADLERWVAAGAPYPRDTRVDTTSARGAGKLQTDHWAYRPVADRALPAVHDVDWPAGDVDRFVLSRLETAGLRPAAEADRATLARRVYYDLTGLPPSPDEVDAFAADGRPDAYERLVDRLLTSPAFGERWGRHWLDVARFAESVTLRGLVFKEAWRYRDYVIDAFDRDVPFEQFVREQVAGDLLPAESPADRRRQLVATGFLVLGNTNLEEQDKTQLRMDVVDEQLDVIGKGLLGQTVTCARCHDHKFDPIPTADYYALAGILRNARALEDANVSKWLEVPLPGDAAEERRLAEHAAAVSALQARLKAERAKRPAAAATKGPVAIKDVPGIVVDDAAATKVGEWKESKSTGTYIGAGYIHDLNEGKGTKTLTFHPDLPASGRYEVRLAYSAGKSRSTAVPVTVFSADGEKTIAVDMQRPPPVEGRYISLGRHQFERNSQGFVIVSNEGTTGHVTADAVVFVPADAPRADAAPADDTVGKLEAELKRLQATGPKRALAMSVIEEAKPSDVRVHVRGSVHTLADMVPRGFLRAATRGTPPTIPPGESGRRQLADWIASPDNPLTGRVLVNRAWHWLFGAGLVRTTDNFGTTGEMPSHPELLDYLATRFVADGWSMKSLVRRIVLSRTYRQSAGTATEKDPENRLLSGQNRRRLDAECIRDTMLAVAGNLRRDRGGPTFPASLTADYNYHHADGRRSVYVPAFRNAVPELLEAFDMADPSVVTGRRNVSTVAPQALSLLNHPFVIEQARLAAGRLLAVHTDDAARVDRAYRLTLGRPPTDGERRAVLRHVERASERKEAWAAVVQALLASIEFRYVN